MEKLSPLLAEWGSMKFLISEILLCLLAASILGLIIGWLCKAAFARDKLMHREDAWRRKYAEREETLQNELKSTQHEAGILKGRIQSIEGDNHSLSSSLEANKSAVHKAHIEVQQLSKRQRDTQERLQKIITEKDREISRLQQESAKGKNRPPRALGFSSRKPAAQQTPPPSQPQPQTPPPVERPAPQPRQTRPAESHIGGRPNTTTQDPGFRPGTQTSNDDFDKTQVIKNEADRSDMSGTQRPLPTSSDRPHDNTAQQRPANQGTLSGDNTAANNTSANHTADNTLDSRQSRKKRSLWDRMKSSVSKKPE